MSKTNTEIGKVISKIETVKKINGQNVIIDKIFDKYGHDDTKNKNQKISSTISDIISDRTLITPPKTNIFGEMINIANAFMDDSQIGVDKKEKKIIRYAKESTKKTVLQSKQIVKEELGYFLTNSGTEICSSNTLLPSGKIYNLSPKEFDFINILKVNPNTLTGKILYEDTTNETGKIKFNNQLFSQFDDTTPYTFKSLNGDNLFDIGWNSSAQSYEIYNTLSNLEIRDFFNHYYETIEYPNTDEIIKNTMLLVLHGDNSTTIDLTNGLNNLEKLSKKILSYCNILNTSSRPLKNNPTDIFNENDTDIERFFDFNDNEGIDIDDEDARYRRVLKFKDCDNFEIPINSTHIEDFVYLNDFSDESIIDTLGKTSNDVSNDSDNYIYFLSLYNTFISKIPTAIIGTLLSPKMLLPVVLVYKALRNITMSDITNDVLILLKKLKNLIFKIVSRVFKIFIVNFWNFIKIDLLKFITKVASQILTNKIKRFKSIILSLISLLTSLLDTDFKNCVDLFSIVGKTIDAAFSAPTKIPLPGFLLGFSDILPGYSSDRAFMNIIENLENNGIPTGPLYGESNDLPIIIKSILDGQINEMDTNSFIKVSNKLVTIPTPIGPIQIPPGILNSTGKLF